MASKIKTTPVMMSAGHVITNGAAPLQIGGLPREMKFLSMGANPGSKGTIVVGGRTREFLGANQKTQSFDRCALDYEHNTVEGSPKYKESTEPRPVAAYFTPELRADGMWMSDIVWTPNGQTNALNYHDLSVAGRFDKNNELVFVHSVALCRQGAITDVSFYSVGMPAADMAGCDNTDTTQEEDTLMEKIIGMLKTALKLPATATDADLAAALTTLCAVPASVNTFTAKIAELEGQIKTFTAKAGDGQQTTDEGQLKTFTTLLESLKGQILALQAGQDKRDRDAIRTFAASQGKVIPLSDAEIAATPIVTLSAMVEKLPVTVPLHAQTPRDVKPFSAGGAKSLTAEELKIGKQLGFTEEEMKKANGIA
jgi:phage I-like protein